MTNKTQANRIMQRPPIPNAYNPTESSDMLAGAKAKFISRMEVAYLSPEVSCLFSSYCPMKNVTATNMIEIEDISEGINILRDP